MVTSSALARLYGQMLCRDGPAASFGAQSGPSINDDLQSKNVVVKSTFHGQCPDCAYTLRGARGSLHREKSLKP